MEAIKPQSIVTNEDCMIGMSRYPEGYFDLAIVDPEYGISEDGERSNRPHKTAKCQNPNGAIKNYQIKKWDKSPVSKQVLDEIFRVSKNQIIWGANHFIERINKNSSCWIVWDKINGDNDFADCELAWTSFDKAVRKIELLWNGFQKCEVGSRIHPTQKPVKLYKWVLKNYANPNDKILDTHLGSGSSRIAAYDMGFDFTGFELDKDYFEAAEKRYQNHIKQLTMFPH